MTKTTFEHIEPAQDFLLLPIRLELRTSRTSAIVKVLMLAPMMALLAVPIMVLGARATETSLVSVARENPIGTVQVIFGLVIWAVLFLWPLKRIIGRMGARRQVEITAEQVNVIDKTPFKQHSWSAPLAAYSGVAHHIRASLSGTRHEIILVHPDSSKNVLLTAADRISQDTLDRAKSLLNMPEVPARQLYGHN